MAITATFIPGANVLAEFGDALDNTFMTSRNAAGNLLVNGGAVAVHGSTATVANTSLIQRTALRRPTTYDVVIVGGGAGGISTASSLRRRRAGLSIAIIEPRETHYYQPGWTLVGGGVFDRSQTERPMARVMPNGVKWIRSAVAEFAPEQNAVVLEDGERVSYRTLIVAAGIELNWDGVEGLRETLGKNGVTSNYMFEMAPYTFELVRSLRKGRALFELCGILGDEAIRRRCLPALG
jgi:sulfide:quinone oxidoreductase